MRLFITEKASAAKIAAAHWGITGRGDGRTTCRLESP